MTNKTNTNITKEALEAHIAAFLEDYRAAHGIAPIWRAPLRRYECDVWCHER